MLLDASEEYNVLELFIDGDTDGDFKNIENIDEEKMLKALIDFEDKKLTGGLLSEEEKDAISKSLLEKDRIYNQYIDPEKGKCCNTKKVQLYEKAILPVIRAIVTSSAYMVE